MKCFFIVNNSFSMYSLVHMPINFFFKLAFHEYEFSELNEPLIYPTGRYDVKPCNRSRLKTKFRSEHIN